MNINQLVEKIIFSLNERNKLSSENLIRELKLLESSESNNLNYLFVSLSKLIFEPSIAHLNIFLDHQIKYGSNAYFFNHTLNLINELSALIKINMHISNFEKLFNIYHLHLLRDLNAIKIIINHEILKNNVSIANLYFENFILKIINLLQEEKKYELLLQIESNLYQSFIKSYENEDHFSYVYNKLNPILRLAGNDLRLNSKDEKVKIIEKSALPIVLFFIHNASMLAHILTLLDFFRGLKKSEEHNFNPVVVCLSNYNSDLHKELNQLKIYTIFLDVELKSSPIINKILHLKHFIKFNKIKIIIVVSVVVYMSFMFSLRIAPIQVWWSMKYHKYKIPEIDFYLTGGSFGENFRITNETKWLVAPGAFSNLVDSSLSSQALIYKKSLGKNKIILGSFGREEKLRSNDFLYSVCNILKSNPNTIFLWTGRSRDTYIHNFFENYDVINQTIFIGWVNTKLYAHVIDIFLDSFPFPAGLTIYEAMALGVPTVLFRVPDNNLGIHANLNNLYYGFSGSLFDQKRVQEIFKKDSSEGLLLLANNKEEYIDYANKLINDIIFREKVGCAGKYFIDEYMSDISKMANGYALHISNILQNQIT
jgi:hypothetical protein